MTPDPAGGRGDGRHGEADERTGGGEEQPQPVAPTAVPLTQQIGRVAVVVAAVLFGIFAVVNAQYVSFNWIFGQTTAEFTDGGEHLRGGVPLIVLLLGSFAVGTALGWVGAWLGRRRRRRDHPGAD